MLDFFSTGGRQCQHLKKIGPKKNGEQAHKYSLKEGIVMDVASNIPSPGTIDAGSVSGGMGLRHALPRKHLFLLWAKAEYMDTSSYSNGHF